MGFWKDLSKGTMRFILDDVYASRRHEIPDQVLPVIERAQVLAEDGTLTPKKLGKLAGWDIDVLRWIGSRDAILPGSGSDQRAIYEAAKKALKIAVEREVDSERPKPRSRKPPAKMRRESYSPTENNDLIWTKSRNEIRDLIRDLGDMCFVTVGPNSTPDRYVQVVRNGAFLWGECSGAAVDGGPSLLTTEEQSALLEMGWGPPDLGPADFPNYRVRWAPEGGSKSSVFISKTDAQDVADFLVSTLRGPLGVYHASDVAIDTGQM